MNVYEDEIVYYTIVKKDDMPGDCDTKKARYLLGWMLNYFGIDYTSISVAEHGKPYFKDLDVCFNYSHSKNYIACAISSCDVGIDIEDSGRKVSDTVSKKYLDGEVDDKEKLVKWVQKEAYSKFVGLGISIIRDISLSNIFDKSIIVRNEDYVCCVCSDCSEFKEIKLF